MRSVHLLVSGAVLLGIGSLLLELAPGPGVYPDSVDYLFAAHTFADGPGLRSVHGGPALDQFTHYPPAYPLLIASAVKLTVGSVVRAATAINVLFWAATLGFWTWALARRGMPRWWVAGTVLFLVTGIALVGMHAMLLTEPVFFFCLSVGLWSLSRYADTGKRSNWWLAVIAVAMAALTRYVGIVAVLTGALFLLVRAPGDGRHRIRSAFGFGLLSAFPLFTWMLRNRRVSGNLADRAVAFHPMGRADLEEFLRTLKALILQLPAPAASSMIIGAVVAGLSVVSLVLFRPSVRRWWAADGWAAAVVLHAVLYLLFLAVSNTFLDNTPLNARILFPALLPVLLLALARLSERWTRLSLRPRVVLVSVLIMLLVLHVNAFVNHLRTHTEAEGYFAPAWTGSAAMARVRSAPSSKPLYSNAVDAIWLLTGRTVRPANELRNEPPPDGSWLVLFAGGGFYNGHTFDEGPEAYLAEGARSPWTVVHADGSARIYRIGD